MSKCKNWYAVYTRPKMEKKVSVLLNRAGIENYCPLNRTTRHWNDRKKITLEPLFSSCVFVKVDETEHELLKKVDGIINIIYWLGKPVVIQGLEIMMIKNMLNECTDIKLEKKPIYLNDKVSFIREAYVKTEGQESTGLKTKTLIAVLPSLGYLMKAEVETGNIKVIESDVSRHYEVNN